MSHIFYTKVRKSVKHFFNYFELREVLSTVFLPELSVWAFFNEKADLHKISVDPLYELIWGSLLSYPKLTNPIPVIIEFENRIQLLQFT